MNTRSPTTNPRDESFLLEVSDLKKYFTQNEGLLDRVFRRDTVNIQAVDGVSLTIKENEVTGIIGESGCGKSTLLNTLIGIYEPTDGDIFFDNQSTSEFNRADWKQYRSDVQIIYQNPFDSLDPKMTVKEILTEPLKIHNKNYDKKNIVETLEKVELHPAESYLNRLPKQLSGGERQRVSIARAIILEPKVILADEPVSMLDVSTQASILQLLSQLSNETNVAIVYISHDLSTVAYICDRVHIMYLGRIVESASTRDVLQEPKHPYTQELIKAVPVPDPHHKRERTQLEGTPSDPINLDSGCRFRDRCPDRMDICDQTPRYVQTDDDHYVACHLYYNHTNASSS